MTHGGGPLAKSEQAHRHKISESQAMLNSPYHVRGKYEPRIDLVQGRWKLELARDDLPTKPDNRLSHVVFSSADQAERCNWSVFTRARNPV